MSTDLNLIEFAVTAAEAETGMVKKKASRGVPLALFAASDVKVAARPPIWTPEEDEFLRKNLGRMSEEKIAKELGRTVLSVQIRWKRELHLTAPSKNHDFITAEKASRLLGLDSHKISHWCDMGLIPYRNMAARRKIRMIYRTTFLRWVVNTDNWIYFDWKKIPDPKLRRLCKLRARRWGDEWWDTVKAAEYHSVTSKDVQRLLYRGELPGVQVAVSRGGRHKDPAWKNWYVKRSDAVKAVFVKGKGNNRTEFKPTPRAIRWMKRAWKLGMNFSQINRSMGSKVTDWTLRNYMVRTGIADLTSRAVNS